MKTSLTVLLTVFCLTSIAQAGVKEALDAQKHGDYETARKEFTALAENGEFLGISWLPSGGI
jgi:hypothetical protein